MERRDVLIQYLQSCVEIADWHGVSDAANDLRELEAAQRDGCPVIGAHAHWFLDGGRSRWVICEEYSRRACDAQSPA